MSALQNTLFAKETENALILHPTASHRVSQDPVQPSVTIPPPPQGFEIDLVDSLLRHWKLAAVIFLIVSALGMIRASSSATPLYQAEATIFISPELAKQIGNGYTENSYTTFVNQQVLSILHLDTLTESLRHLKEKNVIVTAGGVINPQAVDLLRSMLQVQRVPETFEVSVQATATTAQAAAAIANTVARTFVEEEKRPDASGSYDQRTSLTSQEATLKEELQSKMDARAQLAQALQVVNLDKNSSLPDDVVLAEAQQALAAAHTKRIEIEAQIAAGDQTVGVDAIQLASVDPTSRTSVSALLQRQAELRARIKNMLPTHPVRREAETELAQIQAELNQGVGNDAIPRATAELMGKLKAQSDQYRRIELGLGKEIADITANIPSQSRNLKLVEMVNGDITRIQSELERIEGKIDDFRIQSAQQGIRVFSQAQIPDSPIKSRKAKAISFALLLALLLALAVPVLLDVMDSRIQGSSTVERITGLPMIGMTLQRTTLNQSFADEYVRRLSTGIERNISAGATKILFTTLKGTPPKSLVDDIAHYLEERNIEVLVDPDQTGAELGVSSNPVFTENVVTNPPRTSRYQVELYQASALMISADAERLATMADLTLIIVEAGKDTRSDLARGAKLLERLNVPFMTILHNVRIDRAGRTMKRDLKEYNALQNDFALRANARRVIA